MAAKKPVRRPLTSGRSAASAGQSSASKTTSVVKSLFGVGPKTKTAAKKKK